MNPQPHSISGVPAALEQPLSRFCAGLAQLLGERLVSIVLYGGLAKGEYLAGSSDVNLLVVLRDLDLEVLDKMAPLVEQGRREFDLALLLVTKADLAHAAEFFATKFFDLQRNHRVLWGAPLQLEVNGDRVRRQCVRELVNLQWRLRKRYLELGRRRLDSLEVVLKETLSPFLTILAVLEELKTGRPVETKAAAARAAGEIGLRAALLEQLLDWKSGRGQIDPTELKRIFGEFLSVVGQAVQVAETP